MMASPAWLLLHPDGAVDAYPDAFHATADGVVTPAAIDLDLAEPKVADGRTVKVADKQLVVGDTCKLPLGDRRPDALGAGGKHVAIAADGAVLIVDATTCAPVGIVGAEAVAAVAVDDTRLVVLDKSRKLRWFAWASSERVGEALLPGRCSAPWFGAEGPSIECDGVRRLLPSGAPAKEAPIVGTRPAVEEGVLGWSRWDPDTGIRTSPAFGAGEGSAEIDATGTFAVTVTGGAKGAPRELHAWDVGSGKALWTATIPSTGNIQVQPGATLVTITSGWEVYDRKDGHLAWRLRIAGSGLQQVEIEVDGRTFHAGDADAPAWQGEAVQAAVQGPLPVKAPAPVPGRAAAARDAAMSPRDEGPARVLDQVPTIPTGAVGPFAACGESVPSFRGDDRTVPIRKDAPTLVFVGDDDGWAAPEGFDVVLYYPVRDAIGAMSDGTPDRNGDTRVSTFGDFSGEQILPFGLRFGEALMVSGDCRVLARGPADTVLDAAVRLAYRKVGASLPTRSREVLRAARVSGGARRLQPLADGLVAWAGSAGVGVYDADGKPLWTTAGSSLMVHGDARHLYVQGKDVVSEVDPRTGAVLRLIPEATSVRGYGEPGLLVDRGDTQALLDPSTLEPRRIIGSLRYRVSMEDRGIKLGWPGIGDTVYSCVLGATGPQVCGGPAERTVALGTLALTLGRDHVLTARDRRGKAKWSIGGVFAMEAATNKLAFVQLGSSEGQYATIDASGHLRDWLPVDSAPQAVGVGIAGDDRIVWWRP